MKKSLRKPEPPPKKSLTKLPSKQLVLHKSVGKSLKRKHEIRLIWEDVLDGLRLVSDKSVDLVVVDPPYWKISNDPWDKQWLHHDHYAMWVAEWMREVVRVMKRSGSLYMFGFPRNVLPLFPLFTQHPLRFRQIITWDKGFSSLAGRATKNHQMFSTVTEHIFFWQYDSRPWLKDLLRSRQKELGLNGAEINRRLGGATNGGGVWSLTAGDNHFGVLPSAEVWPRFQEVLSLKHIAHGDFYPVFNVAKGVGDVWSISNRVKDRFHSAQKPEAVIERMVKASSSSGMTVLDPFMGSATTGKICQLLDRDFIGIEKDRELVDKVCLRLGIKEVAGRGDGYAA